MIDWTKPASRDVTIRGDVTIWIDDVRVPAVFGTACQRVWTVWRDVRPRRRVGFTTNPRDIKALVQEARK